MNRELLMRAGPSSSLADPVVVLDHVGMRFGRVHALQDISLSLRGGAVHAFVGQNGAGKSTCCGIIAGRNSATEGTVRVGEAYYPAHASPRLAQAAGVATIWQELTVLPEMTVLENVFISRLTSRLGVVRRRQMRAEFTEFATRLKVSFGPDRKVGDLSVADRQMVEIMRAIAQDSRVLILDEPTATLSPAERDTLFELMDDLRADGVCLIWVSHFLDEVLAHADDVVVFRDGRLVESRPSRAWDEKELVQSMLGDRNTSLARQLSTRQWTGSDRPPVLEAHDIGNAKLNGVSLAVRPGEIVGIAGLVGAGRSTLCRVLGGSQRASTGSLRWHGADMPLPSSPRAARRLGIAYTSEDRRRDGLFPAMTSRENITLPNIEVYSRFGLVGTGRLQRAASTQAARFGIPTTYLSRPASALSGGNQQKLLLARAALQQPQLLIADEPTRGIDLGAKAQIMSQLREYADHGGAVLFVSSDLDEVAELADRTYVLRGGRIRTELGPQHGDTSSLLNAAFGLDRQ